jgi:hypothetical protein
LSDTRAVTTPIVGEYVFVERREQLVKRLDPVIAQLAREALVYAAEKDDVSVLLCECPAVFEESARGAPGRPAAIAV